MHLPSLWSFNNEYISDSVTCNVSTYLTWSPCFWIDSGQRSFRKTKRNRTQIEPTKWDRSQTKEKTEPGGTKPTPTDHSTEKNQGKGPKFKASKLDMLSILSKHGNQKLDKICSLFYHWILLMNGWIAYISSSSS